MSTDELMKTNYKIDIFDNKFIYLLINLIKQSTIILEDDVLITLERINNELSSTDTFLLQADIKDVIDLVDIKPSKLMMIFLAMNDISLYQKENGYITTTEIDVDLKAKIRMAQSQLFINFILDSSLELINDIVDYGIYVFMSTDE